MAPKRGKGKCSRARIITVGMLVWKALILPSRSEASGVLTWVLGPSRGPILLTSQTSRVIVAPSMGTAQALGSVLYLMY